MKRSLPSPPGLPAAPAGTLALEVDRALATRLLERLRATQADAIDISDVLSGLGVNAGNLSQYVDVTLGNGVRVDVTGSSSFGAPTQIASFAGSTNVTDEATMLVEWKDAKVQPANLPEIPTPPRWLPFVFAGFVGLGVFLFLRRRKK